MDNNNSLLAQSKSCSPLSCVTLDCLFCKMSSDLPSQDTFDIRILMAKSVKHTVNFLETKEEDLYRCVCVCVCVCARACV